MSKMRIQVVGNISPVKAQRIWDALTMLLNLIGLDMYDMIYIPNDDELDED